MKEWQHGYELDYLLRVEALFSQYNAAIRSPFQQMKKNRVAEALSKGQLRFDEENKCSAGSRSQHQRSDGTLHIDNPSLLTSSRAISSSIASHTTKTAATRPWQSCR